MTTLAAATVIVIVTILLTATTMRQCIDVVTTVIALRLHLLQHLLLLPCHVYGKLEGKIWRKLELLTQLSISDTKDQSVPHRLSLVLELGSLG
jgi:hypothetical protein